MAYSLETSSVKTIVPGAEVSGFADVVARQKITALSGEVPQLSAGEGIDISTVDGKTVITNNISAGSNISLVYDMETNTYRIDGTGGGPDPASAVTSQNFDMPTMGLYTYSGVKISGGNETLYFKSITAGGDGRASAISFVGPYVTYLTGTDSLISEDYQPLINEHWYNIIAATKGVSDNLWNWNQTFNTVQTNSASWANAGHTYTGIAPIQVNNTTDEISITGESLSAGPGIDMFSSGGYVVVSSTGKELSAGPGIDLFESGGYFVISANGGSELPSAISAWEFTTYSQPYYETYTHDAHIYSASFKALSSQYGGTPTSYPILEFNEQINRSNTSSVNNSKLSHEGIWVRSGTVLTEGDYSEIDYNDRTYVKPNLLQLNFTNLYENGVSANGTSASWSSIINSTFPITGTNGTTGFTANMNCSSMYLSTGAGPAGAIVHFDTKGVHFEAYPSTDVSASWFNLITQYNNVTCSAVKLTTAASETRFVTSALPNLNEITFIAPSYGPYETYSALIDDGETTFVAEVDSGCCIKVVRNWNDDRGKNCWCGLNQETYFYIG